MAETVPSRGLDPQGRIAPEGSLARVFLREEPTDADRADGRALDEALAKEFPQIDGGGTLLVGHARVLSELERQDLGCVRFMSRRLVRTAFTLVMPRWNGWTSDLHEMAEAFGAYYPARRAGARGGRP